MTLAEAELFSRSNGAETDKSLATFVGERVGKERRLTAYCSRNHVLPLHREAAIVSVPSPRSSVDRAVLS